jgi:two-component system chemotaxis response regulator CheB
MQKDANHFRILLVDDSSVVRRVLTDVISSDPQLEVIGTAPNGRVALDRIAQLKPDLVVLDIEMPEMDGLKALAELRKTNRRLPVIMFSTLTQRGGAATLDALALGADDYVPKERNTLGLAAAIDDLRRDLLPKIHALCSRDLADKMPAISREPRTAPGHKLPEHRIDLIVVGVSTGGPEALSKFLAGIPKNLPVPMVMVQHMPPIFTKLLAERLTIKSAMPVKEASGGEPLVPGTIWIAPGGKHLSIVTNQDRLCLHTDDKTPPRNFCRPAVDVLFEAGVRVAGAGTLGVVLTGMGKDGLEGCEAIREKGGQIVVQNQETSVVWGMPGAVVQAGIADAIKPIHEVSQEVMQRVMKFRNKLAPVNAIPVPRGAYVQQGK